MQEAITSLIIKSDLCHHKGTVRLQIAYDGICVLSMHDTLYGIELMGI